MILGRGFLRKEYYQTWADYFIRFLDEYSSQGLEMWGLTAQNEPADGRIPDFFFNSMGWTAEEQVNDSLSLIRYEFLMKIHKRVYEFLCHSNREIG